MRLTTRGWIVLVIVVLAMVIGINVLMSGKYVACDLRNTSDCHIAQLEPAPNNDAPGDSNE